MKCSIMQSTTGIKADRLAERIAMVAHTDSGGLAQARACICVYVCTCACKHLEYDTELILAGVLEVHLILR